MYKFEVINEHNIQMLHPGSHHQMKMLYSGSQDEAPIIKASDFMLLSDTNTITRYHFSKIINIAPTCKQS